MVCPSTLAIPFPCEQYADMARIVLSVDKERDPSILEKDIRVVLHDDASVILRV